ncbi:MAG: hypothetical protein WCG93_11120 [Paludibacter sp.]|jgi:hypothetical protein
MKKPLFIIAVVAFLATICFFQTNTVSNSNYSVDVPPIIIKPPFKVQGTNSTMMLINIEALAKTTTKLV